MQIRMAHPCPQFALKLLDRQAPPCNRGAGWLLTNLFCAGPDSQYLALQATQSMVQLFYSVAYHKNSHGQYISERACIHVC